VAGQGGRGAALCGLHRRRAAAADRRPAETLHEAGFEIGVETNGTIAAPAGLDWVCVSPKSTAALVQRRGNELKLVYRQADAAPEAFADLAFDFFFLQPMDGPSRAAETAAAIEYCRRRPQWRLSLQTHKLLGIP
jgi:organic radical activating enzyme